MVRDAAASQIGHHTLASGLQRGQASQQLRANATGKVRRAASPARWRCSSIPLNNHRDQLILQPRTSSLWMARQKGAGQQLLMRGRCGRGFFEIPCIPPVYRKSIKKFRMCDEVGPLRQSGHVATRHAATHCQSSHRARLSKVACREPECPRPMSQPCCASRVARLHCPYSQSQRAAD